MSWLEGDLQDLSQKIFHPALQKERFSAAKGPKTLFQFWRPKKGFSVLVSAERTIVAFHPKC